MAKYVVYKIQNKTNGEFYVGRSGNCKIRFSNHISKLRKNKHHCFHLQCAWNKYGEKNFKFEVIESGLTLKQSIEREQYYLDTFKEIYNASKNATSGGQMHTLSKDRDGIIERIRKATIQRSERMTPEERKKTFGNPGESNPMYGKTHSEEARKNISEKNKAYFEENDGYRKGKTFEELFGEEKAAELKENLSKSASERKGDKNAFYGKKHTEEFKKKASERMKAKNIKPKNSRPVMIDGVQYESATAASRELGVVAATILHRITSNNPKYAGYHYVGESPCEQAKVHAKVIIVDGVEYASLKEAALVLGIHQSTVSQRLRSKKPEHSGYRYKEEAVTV